MSADQYLARLSCRQELNNSPLGATVTPYVEALLTQLYAKSTIRLYLHAIAHFGHWMKAEALCLESIDTALTERFVCEHLPACTCSKSLHSDVADTRAALRHLLKLLAQQRPVKSPGDDPITAERIRSMNPTFHQMGLRLTVASPASSSTAAALRSPLLTRHAATAQVRGAATYRAPGRWPSRSRPGCRSAHWQSHPWACH